MNIKTEKIRFFFAFLLLSAYFFMLTPLYSYSKLEASTLQKLVTETTDKQDWKNFLKMIEKMMEKL